MSSQSTPENDTLWNGLYRLGGAAALTAVLITLADMIISFAGGDNAAGVPAADWFALFAQSPLLGLRNLGLFNILTNALALPLFLALFAAHRRTQPAAAALAGIVLLFGAAVYTANNQALPMLALSGQYAAAGEAGRELLTGAGAALLAQGEDFTPGSFPGFFFCLLANGLMAAALLRGRIFRPWIAVTGLAAAAIMLVFTTAATFQLATVEALMPLALVGGLYSWAWNIALALRLFRLARPARETGRPAARPLDAAAEGAR
ncbi:MAG TPA: hypothetical protein VFF68_09535 [Anaerolineaceae bacterium]|nr:hypothetical protein [Anaerolineaceae bacterium]